MKTLGIICFICAAVSLVVESRGIIKGELELRNLLIPAMWAGFGVWQWTRGVKRARKIYPDDPPQTPYA
jgi:hypothetical protein